MNPRLRDFVAHHDDRWLFVVVYIGLAVVLSIVLSLFWLVAVAGLHFVLEYLRQAQHRAGVVEVVSHAVWEIKLDIALVLLALAMSLYMELVLGVLGLQSAGRAAAATRVTRFAAWERNLRALVLLADDVARVVQVGVTRFLRRPAARVATEASSTGTAPARRGAAATASAAARGAAGASGRPGTAPTPSDGRGRRAVASHAPPPPAVPRSWRDGWTSGDRFTLGLLVGCVLLIVFAPVLTEHSWTGATVTLLEQLHPFPSR